MKKLDQRGVIGHIEILVIVVVVAVAGFAVWRITSSKDEPLTNQQTTGSADIVNPADTKFELAQKAQLIDLDRDGIPLCIGENTTDCESKELDNDFDNDGLNDQVDTDDDNDGIPDTEDTDKDNDGIEDVDENDYDNDGIEDSQDPDDDNDGIKDTEDSDNGGTNGGELQNN